MTPTGHLTASQRTTGSKYHRVMTLTQSADGLATTRDAPTAKPQSFRTADGWFAYNLNVNLAQM